MAHYSRPGFRKALLAIPVIALAITPACSSGGGDGPSAPTYLMSLDSLAGTWTYHILILRSAGCYQNTCYLDSTLTMMDGTVTLSAPAPTSHSGGRYTLFKAHHDLTLKFWPNAFGTCDGQPLSCFTADPPTSVQALVGDSTMEVGEDGHQASFTLRNVPHLTSVDFSSFQWGWTVSLPPTPTRLYDSLGSFGNPLFSGVHDMQKQ